MRFERHAFISYTHIDNRPLPTEKDGWVTLFHETLQQLLAGRLGGNADVWRDDKLRGNDIFSDEILAQFPKTAAVVTVVSPRYLKSEWCTREIDEFCSVAERTGGLVVGNKCRVFKVLKLPSEGPSALPPVLSQVLGYEFYELDDDKTPRELDPAYGEKSKQDFLRRIARLAWDIKLLVERLEAAAGPSAAPAPRPTVYLAECGRDRRDAREMLEAELTRLGYTVLPDKELPRDEVDYVAEVDRLLAQSQFSIHLVGGAVGLVPDGTSQKSVVVLQNERAVQRSRTVALPRLIWLPDGTSSAHPAQAAFIGALHRDAGAQFGADLITGDLETLKGATHAALKKLEQAVPPRPPAPAAVTSSRARVHVLCDERDRKAAIVLLRALKERIEVTLPIFTGDAANVREVNQELLVGCDAVILYYGAGDETWRFHQQNELKRVRAIRTDRVLPPEIIYLGEPRTDDKEVLAALEGQHIIDALSGFPEVAVAAFLTRMVPVPPAS